jgi:hypothetical protein
MNEVTILMTSMLYETERRVFCTSNLAVQAAYMLTENTALTNARL